MAHAHEHNEGVIERLQNKVPCLMSRGTSFVLMTVLLGGFFLIEVVVGYVTNSMALIADSFHMLSDVASLIVGYLALRLSTANSPREMYTYGYARAEVLGALVNAVFLVALCFSIFIESMKRLVILEGIDNPILVFCVGLAGLVVNIFGMFLFHQTGHGHSHGGMSHVHSHGGDHHAHGDSHSYSHSHSHGGGSTHAHSHGSTGHAHAHGGHSLEGGGNHQEKCPTEDTCLQTESQIKIDDVSITRDEVSIKTDDVSIKHDDVSAKQDTVEVAVEEEEDESKDFITGLKYPNKRTKVASPNKRPEVASQETSTMDGVEVGKPGGATLDDVSDIEIENIADEKINLLATSRNRADPPASRKKGVPPPPSKSGKSAGQLNIEGVYLHILGDALGSIIVMISALFLIYGKGAWTLYVDPSMSIIMVLIILKTSIPLLMETSKILMNSAPQHIQINDLRERLLSTMPEIKNVHELHVWQLAGDKIIASVHVKFESPEDYDETAAKIKDFFHDEGIHSTTVQIEFARDDVVGRGQCMVVCSLDSACDDMMCCKPDDH